MTGVCTECAIVVLVFAIMVNALESSEIRMLESEYGKRSDDYRTILNPNEYTAIARRDAKLMNPLIRFGKKAIIRKERNLSRNTRTEGFQSTPLIRFGKRNPSEGGPLLRSGRNTQQRSLADETVLHFGRSASSAAA